MTKRLQIIIPAAILLCGTTWFVIRSEKYAQECNEAQQDWLVNGGVEPTCKSAFDDIADAFSFLSA
jgi:hypothetical protein